MAEMGGVTCLLLLLCAGATVGRGLDLQKRIIGGAPCDSKERLHHAKLVQYTNKLVCGGTLISNRWILTAAHCLKWIMFAYVGERGRGQKRIPIIDEKIFKDGNGEHDMMLLKLGSDPGVDHAHLPDCTKHPSPDSGEVQIAGYGATKVDNTEDKQIRGYDKPDELQCANIDIVKCDEVIEFQKNEIPEMYNLYEHQYKKCIQRNKVDNKVDVCKGDSGGGVLRKIDTNDVIYGVLVLMGNPKCVFDKPGVFLDVCKYSGWIEGIKDK